MANLIRRRGEREQGGEMTRGGWGLDPWRVMGELMRWDPLRDIAPAQLGGMGTFVPAFDVSETKDAYVFTADLPGLRDEDVDIQVSGNTLTISGRRQTEESQESEQYHYSERSYGEFRRSFTLPDGADASATEAELKNGVLRLTVRKRAEVQPKRIEIGSRGKSGGPKA